ncbi:type II toxin-antitoxin system Rv0910 family toxin [Actinospica sp.]|jgi:carbon monoxide dehydrogenase subunit G|uniref:type II toxin-antitoxin system Rv0910 family toxin n=1 Tax=Actinospica sp. TaxID=1872142 RepID=UPI002B9AD24D|nr:SRPBCC family protein [Actinospica sp.]HWG25314.1 SRPBCC family protein [Actinospica sp.]
MPEVSVSAPVAAPADKVWALITDFGRFSEWNDIHTDFPHGVPAALAVGNKYSEKMALMGMPAEVSWTVTELEPGRSYLLQGNGPMGISVRQQYSVDDGNEGSLVTVGIEFKGTAVTMMAGKIKDATTTALTESLRKLAALVA